MNIMYCRTLARSAFFCFQKRNFNQSQHFPKAENKTGIKITQACVDRLKEIATNEQFLRVTVDGGGCSGFQYRFDLDSNIQDDDECFEKDGAKIIIDKISLPFLKGSTVDYHEELIRSAFRITDNPQAGSGCSCGSSFTVKM